MGNNFHYQEYQARESMTGRDGKGLEVQLGVMAAGREELNTHPGVLSYPESRPGYL